MKKLLLIMYTIIAVSISAVAGKDVVPAVVPIIPITEDEPGQIYVGLGAKYNLVYSADHGWFDDGFTTQDETAGLIGILGYQYNKHLAIEGRISKTIWEENYSDTSIYSIFLKPQYHISEDFTIYGLLGFGNTNVEGTTEGKAPPGWAKNNGKTLMDETGFQWGFGLMYDVTEDWSLFADYTMLAKNVTITPTQLYGYDNTFYDKLSVEGLNVGVIYKF